MKFFSKEFGLVFEYNSLGEYVNLKFKKLMFMIGGFIGKLIFYGVIIYLLYKYC